MWVLMRYELVECRVYLLNISESEMRHLSTDEQKRKKLDIQWQTERVIYTPHLTFFLIRINAQATRMVSREYIKSSNKKGKLTKTSKRKTQHKTKDKATNTQKITDKPQKITTDREKNVIRAGTHHQDKPQKSQQVARRTRIIITNQNQD